MFARISNQRMAEMKYDEAVKNSQANREGKRKEMTISRCPCGSPNCGGGVYNQFDYCKVNSGFVFSSVGKPVR